MNELFGNVSMGKGSNVLANHHPTFTRFVDSAPSAYYIGRLQAKKFLAVAIPLVIEVL